MKLLRPQHVGAPDNPRRNAPDRSGIGAPVGLPDECVHQAIAGGTPHSSRPLPQERSRTTAQPLVQLRQMLLQLRTERPVEILHVRN